MRLAAYFMNGATWALLAWLLIESGGPDKASEFAITALMFFGPLVNVIALVRSGAPSASWLGLYFRRKALEEQKKIEALGISKGA